MEAEGQWPTSFIFMFSAFTCFFCHCCDLTKVMKFIILYYHQNAHTTNTTYISTCTRLTHSCKDTHTHGKVDHNIKNPPRLLDWFKGSRRGLAVVHRRLHVLFDGVLHQVQHLLHPLLQVSTLRRAVLRAGGFVLLRQQGVSRTTSMGGYGNRMEGGGNRERMVSDIQ